MANFGISFLPSGTGGNGPRDPNAEPPQPIQQAIKVLSLRLPKVVGANAPVPAPLLTSSGGGGRPDVDSVVSQILRRVLAGQGQPTTPSLPTPQPQAPAPPASGSATPRPQSQPLAPGYSSPQPPPSGGGGGGTSTPSPINATQPVTPPPPVGPVTPPPQTPPPPVAAPTPTAPPAPPVPAVPISTPIAQTAGQDDDLQRLLSIFGNKFGRGYDPNNVGRTQAGGIGENNLLGSLMRPHFVMGENLLPSDFPFDEFGLPRDTGRDERNG